MVLRAILNDLTGGDDALAEAAVQSLARLPERDQLAASPQLQQQLASPDVDRRWWATRAIAELSLPQALDWLAGSLADSDPSVRQCAALGVRTHLLRLPPGDSHASISEPLLDALLHGLKDPDPLAARLVAHALAAIGAPAVPPLLELLDEPDHMLRLLVVRTLAEIADPRAIPALVAALDADSLMMEYWATEGLEKMGVGMAYFFP